MMLEHGFVTSVTVTEGIPNCAVQPVRVNTEYTDVPVLHDFRGLFFVPEIGSKVTMLKLGEQRFIVGVLERNPDGENPDLAPGEFAIQLDGSTKIEFTKNGSNYDVAINASGDVTINADGNVLIDGIDFDQHTHGYSWGDTAGSGTTDSPS